MSDDDINKSTGESLALRFIQASADDFPQLLLSLATIFVSDLRVKVCLAQISFSSLVIVVKMSESAPAHTQQSFTSDLKLTDNSGMSSSGPRV